MEGITGFEISPDKEGRTALRIDSDSTDADEISKKLFFAFSQAGTAVLQMTMDHVDLEDVFVELTGKSVGAQT